MRSRVNDILQHRVNFLVFLVAIFCFTILLFPIPTMAEESVQSLMTEYEPEITEIISDSGFTHPGVGLTKEHLENIREQLRNQEEPWNTYFNQMLLSPTASKDVRSSNQSGEDPTKPASDAFNSQGFQSRFIDDALKAYTQSILYIVTGDEIYRANAMHIIRIWSQMDPDKYVYYNDAHIHSGIPLFRMVSAAEILRYSSTQNKELEWTDKDTEDFSNNLIMPAIDTFQYSPHYFMNQHLYPLIGAMSGYIFTDNQDRYEEGVEWFTVNKGAVDQGRNGAIKQLFRLVDTNIVTGEKLDQPRVQIAEMGRDQAHSAGDVTNVEYLARMLLAQDTKVDPVTGEASTAADAVNPYNFLDQRILKGSDYFARFMLGYDTPWTPLAAYMDPDGNPNVIYHQLSEAYRGRIGGNVYGHYYYYKYVEGLDMEEEAPYFTEMFKKRHPFWWESPDGGADYWLYIPEEAKEEGEELLPKVSPNSDLIEIELRYTSLDEHSWTEQEEDRSFVRVNATEKGSKLALVASGNGARTIGLHVRTDDTVTATINLGREASFVLPDTGGQWKYVLYELNDFQFFGDLVYLTIQGNEGATVDIDHINIAADSQLTPLEFKNGQSPLKLFGYVGGDALIEYDFSVHDEASRNISYQMDHKPDGAEFNEDSGMFSWNPDRTGRFSTVVSASDETTLVAREVELIVTDDRESAIKAVIEPYDEEIKYIDDTLKRYKQAYDETVSVIESASDTVFYQKLEDLNQAVEGLQKLTPLLQDGSIDYSRMLVSSTFGDQLINLLDGKPDSFAGYYLADNLKYYMDFGPSYKISADSFQMQVRAGFPDRIGGVAVFGSNDKENWTRLTPDTTEVSSEMQTLAVDDELKNEQYRFLKIEMVNPPGGNPMLELSELRIFGERHETVNKLSAVSISSAQSKQNRIVIGDTVELSFKSTEKINDVNVMIQGKAASVKSNDGLNWKAEAVMGANTTPGDVRFSINYKTNEGIDAEETIFTTDDSVLYLADESDLIRYIIDSTDITDSSGRSPEDARMTASLLFDDDPGTITDYRVNGSGSGGWVAFDFKEGGYAKLTRVELLPRQDGYYHRIGGTVIQGSHDGEEWTTISNEAGSTLGWQSLEIHSEEAYRYIRIYNWHNWFGNMSEVRFHGESHIEDFVSIHDVSIQSDNPDNPSIALPGDTVSLMFTTDDELKNAQVFFGEEEVEVTSEDKRNWLAKYTIDVDNYTVGDVEFSITADNGPMINKTFDGSSVFVIDSIDVALEKADNLDYEDYSRLGYYQFMEKVQFVRDNIDHPDYSETELALMLYEAKSLLTQRSYSIYSFEGNADSSDGFFHGEVEGEPEYKEGKVGEAIDLNGRDHFITLPENHSLSNYDEITVATWVKWRGGNQWQRIFDFGNNQDQYLFLTPSSGDHTLRFAIKNGGSEQFVETASLPIDEWVHVAITLGNDTAILYVDGEEVAVAEDVTIKPSDFKPKINYIGNSMYPDPLFNGMIDEFSIFGYALNSDEIEDIYNNEWLNVDTSLLDFLMNAANKKLNEGDYSEESKEQLIQAIEDAEKVYQGDLTQEAIDHAANVLLEAIENLEELEPVEEVDPSALEELLATAKAYLEDETSYTEASLEVLEKAISNAESLLADEEVTQAELDEALEALTEAIENLEELEPVEEVDPSALEELLATAKEYLEDGTSYTEASLEVLEKAISNAESILADEEVTQAELDEALEALTEAIDNLEELEPVEEVDPSALEELLEIAKAYLEDGTSYTEASLEVLEKAISNAESLLADEEVTQAELDEAIEALAEAIEHLEELEPVEEVDPSALEELLAIAREYIEDGTSYTEASLEVLEKAISNAESLLADEEVTQAELDEALEALTEAIENLEELEPVEEVDPSALEELLAIAREYIEDGTSYTEASLEVLEKAISNAESLLADEEVTQAELDEALEALAEAIESLEQVKPIIDTKELERLLKKIRNILENVKVGDEVGQYPQSAVDDLQKVFDMAEELISTEEASQFAIDQMIKQVEEALNVFEKSINQTSKEAPQPELTETKNDQVREPSAEVNVLPKTATNIYHVLLIGLMLMISGIWIIGKQKEKCN
ncbi:FIVAR domain-containing protein [Amphibacillus sp. MSJ-3]|uniref:LamG-like jellyroll fold domain-containing protein n=1 Tax=Amphibacillus sp. MSJ-3 TaxID=2841505 RepID=UPI001C0EA328|nr:LamG-like jellyroll fold domain-containing protein [Amphibacillus sp. MSJ-3]MBU5595498.1 FIVAR domain-containing protein [Amphibacillus sp. MSJ-3]